LSTIENLLVPRGFRKSGASSEAALADYGMIQGMVFPIIAFPSAFFYSLSELIVPELTEAQVNGRTQEISHKVGRILYLCILFSFGVTAAFFQFAGELGACIYQNAAVGHYIRALAFLMPVIFLDSVADGMLRGLGQQMHVMRYNILDSFLSVILVYFLLPIYAVPGFIFMIYFTDLFNFTLSIHRLRVITKFRLPFKQILSSLVCAWGSVSLTSFFTRIVGLAASPTAWSLTFEIILSLAVYTALLFLLGCLVPKDVKWFKSHFAPKRSPAGQ
jgi:stage V sporulation protein B